jgi:hypothetical protein
MPSDQKVCREVAIRILRWQLQITSYLLANSGILLIFTGKKKNSALGKMRGWGSIHRLTPK